MTAQNPTDDMTPEEIRAAMRSSGIPVVPYCEEDPAYVIGISRMFDPRSRLLPGFIDDCRQRYPAASDLAALGCETAKRPTTFGHRLRAARLMARCTPQELADGIGQGRPSVVMVEKGTRESFNAAATEAAARLLRVSALWLKDGVGDGSDVAERIPGWLVPWFVAAWDVRALVATIAGTIIVARELQPTGGAKLKGWATLSCPPVHAPTSEWVALMVKAYPLAKGKPEWRSLPYLGLIKRHIAGFGWISVEVANMRITMTSLSQDDRTTAITVHDLASNDRLTGGFI